MSIFSTSGWFQPPPLSEATPLFHLVYFKTINKSREGGACWGGGTGSVCRGGAAIDSCPPPQSYATVLDVIIVQVLNATSGYMKKIPHKLFGIRPFTIVLEKSNFMLTKMYFLPWNKTIVDFGFRSTSGFTDLT